MTPPVTPKPGPVFFRCKRTGVLLTNLSTKRFELQPDASIQEEYLPAHMNAKWQSGRVWLPNEYDLLISKP